MISLILQENWLRWQKKKALILFLLLTPKLQMISLTRQTPNLLQLKIFPKDGKALILVKSLKKHLLKLSKIQRQFFGTDQLEYLNLITSKKDLAQYQMLL